MIHDKRMFSHLQSDKNLNKIDIDKGFIMYKKAREEKSDSNPPPFGFYM